jgi:hypothetical protein
VKDGIFDTSSINSLLVDMNAISDGGSVLSPAKMGTKGSTVVGSESLRGDLTCWITPELCKDLSLPAMKSFVQAMIKVLKPYQKELGLVADYSVQCALYVSSESV